MKIIIDSGSTKTDWCLTHDGNKINTVKSEGVNPFFQSSDEIKGIMSRTITKLNVRSELKGVYYYGAGTRDNMHKKIFEALLEVLKNNKLYNNSLDISVESDLLGAARALCQRHEGIACILGTGSNSCLFDGEKITENIPPLGYILGDEGSGAVMGRNFLNALYKKKISDDIRMSFEKEYNTNLAEIIEKTYRQPMPNRFLASMAPFISKHMDDTGVRNMLKDHFKQFFRNNIDRYSRPDLPINFIGSIAIYFKEVIAECAKNSGYIMGKAEKSPIEGLITYHND